MDLVPFLEINMLQLKDSSINELKKFCKDNFDKDKIFSTAEELKYSSLIKGVLLKEFESPSDDFVRFILTDIYDGQKNQRVIEKFAPVVKRAFSALVNEIVKFLPPSLQTLKKMPKKMSMLKRRFLFQKLLLQKKRLRVFIL